MEGIATIGSDIAKSVSVPGARLFRNRRGRSPEIEAPLCCSVLCRPQTLSDWHGSLRLPIIGGGNCQNSDTKTADVATIRKALREAKQEQGD